MNCKKSSLELVSTASQTVTSNQALSFPTVSTQTGCSVQQNGSSNIKISSPGLYQIFASVTGFESGTPGNISVQLSNNGNLITGVIASAYSGETTDVETLVVSTLLAVNPSCCAVDNTANISLINTGVGATYTSGYMYAVRLA